MLDFVKRGVFIEKQIKTPRFSGFYAKTRKIKEFSVLHLTIVFLNDIIYTCDKRIYS